MIRIATTDDALVIARTLRAFNAEYDDPAPEESWLAARVADLLGDDTLVVLSEQSEEVVGLALLRIRRSLWEDADEAYLAELYVRPELRGRGLGKALLVETMAEARRRGCTYMDLTTTNQDEAAVALYESVGFDRHERSGPDTWSYYFEIDL